MLYFRPSSERGYADHGWLQTQHSFSFAQYYDPEHMGWGPIRVINEDIIAPGTGFEMHPHRKMEIITLVLSGLVRHEDDFGNAGDIKAGEIQVMSAGAGVFHSEKNPSASEPLHLYQIWIEPKQSGGKPSYTTLSLPSAGADGFSLICSPDRHNGSANIKQDLKLYFAEVKQGQDLRFPYAEARCWVQLIDGRIALDNGRELAAGDGLGISEETVVARSQTDVKALVFDF